MTALSPAAIRARAGNKCECRGACGERHPSGYCRRRPAVSDRARQTAFVIVGDRQYCEFCGRKIAAKQEAA